MIGFLLHTISQRLVFRSLAVFKLSFYVNFAHQNCWIPRALNWAFSTISILNCSDPHISCENRYLPRLHFMRLIAVFLWLCLVQVALPKRGGSSKSFWCENKLTIRLEGGGRGISSSRGSSSRGWGSSGSSRGSGSGGGGGFSFTKGGRSYQRQLPVT